MTDLQQALQKGVFELNDASDRYKENIFRISSLVGCASRLYYQTKLGIKPKMLGRMLSGIIFHEHLKDIVKNIPEFEDAEFEPEICEDFGDYKILGHADIVTEDRVFEFKYSLVDFDKYGVPDSWHLQANCYATILKKPFYSIVQVNSANLNVIIVEGKQNQDGYNIIKDRAKNIFDSLQSNVCPIGPLADWQCWDCECKEICENYKKKQEGNNKNKVIELVKPNGI
jgi:hypothetical protein